MNATAITIVTQMPPAPTFMVRSTVRVTPATMGVGKLARISTNARPTRAIRKLTAPTPWAVMNALVQPVSLGTEVTATTLMNATPTRVILTPHAQILGGLMRAPARADSLVMVKTAPI